MSELVLITSNMGKLREVQSILGESAVIRNMPLDLPELQGSTARAISIEKAIEAFRRVGVPVLVEDTSLSFEALGGLPGPYIKWFLESVGVAGLHTMLKGFENYRASAICLFVFTDGLDSKNCQVFEGRVEGTIVPPRGDNGFGWDKIFQPIGSTKTFAEMSSEEKNAISHRKLALNSLKSGLLALNDRKRPREDEAPAA